MSRNDETCWTVVRGAMNGDTRARGVFAETYLDVVRAYLGARWRDNQLRQRLDDAVQDVFMDCFRSDGALGRVDPARQVAFRTFLYGVVRNVALRYEERGGRGRERQAPSTFEVAGVPADDPALSRAFDKAWARSVLARAAARQEEAAMEEGAEALKRVELLQLRFGEGLPIRDIAVKWDDDPARLHHEYAKAREEFKKALREVVAFHNPDAPRAVEKEVEAILGFLRD
ncbi:MAG: RNA polymerase subunit sigma-24 [Planctomycetes bacterium]|jgi:RNA polymerase sigma-70 factor (ECF subfamily)|nr:RNA polymerase subunit sigma-24 [Planctomycetota bacterium]